MAGQGGPTGQDAIDRAREKALGALSRGDRAGARKLLRQAIRACESAGDLERLWTGRMALGLTYLRVEGQDAVGAAVRELSLAARGALACGDEAGWLKCLAYLAETVAADPARLGDLEALADAGGDAVSTAARESAAAVVGTARGLATVVRAGRPPAGIDPLLAALATPEAARELEAGAGDGWARIVAAGKAQVDGDLDRAEREASAAKDQALAATDPVLYALACGALARVRDERGDRVGALTALFSCKASLEDLLGAEGGAQVVPMIDALSARWGAEGFARALASYRRQFEGGVQ